MTIVMRSCFYELGISVFMLWLSFFCYLTASALDTGVRHGDERSSSAELDFLCVATEYVLRLHDSYVDLGWEINS